MTVTSEQQRLQILQERQLRKLEKRLERALRRARRKVDRAAQKDFLEKTDINVVIAISNYRADLVIALERQAGRIIPKFQTFVELTAKSYSIPLEKKVSTAILIAQYIALYALVNVDEIAGTAEKDALLAIAAAKNALADGIVQGLPEKELSKIIRGKFTALSTIGRSRANTIARTESHNASTYATQATAQSIQDDEGVTMLKRWIPAVDERTRPTHAVMVSQPAIPIGERFIVGGFEADRPGDPDLPPQESINCRCQLIYERK